VDALCRLRVGWEEVSDHTHNTSVGPRALWSIQIIIFEITPITVYCVRSTPCRDERAESERRAGDTIEKFYPTLLTSMVWTQNAILLAFVKS
jgi:hypothetical protein